MSSLVQWIQSWDVDRQITALQDVFYPRFPFMFFIPVWLQQLEFTGYEEYVNNAYGVVLYKLD